MITRMLSSPSGRFGLFYTRDGVGPTWAFTKEVLRYVATSPLLVEHVAFHTENVKRTGFTLTVVQDTLLMATPFGPCQQSIFGHRT